MSLTIHHCTTHLQYRSHIQDIFIALALSIIEPWRQDNLVSSFLQNHHQNQNNTVNHYNQPTKLNNLLHILHTTTKSSSIQYQYQSIHPEYIVLLNSL